MKSWRIIAVLLLFLVLAGSTACSPFGNGNQEEASQQLVKVVRGDLMVSISGSGNIEVTNEAKLAFGIGGRVDKIYVKGGDEVSGGEVLAKLDTGALELALAQAEVALTQAEVALEVAKFNLAAMEDVAEAQDAVSDAEYDVKIAEAELKAVSRLGYITGLPDYWTDELIRTRAELVEAQQELAEVLADPDYAGVTIDEVVIKQLQVETAEQSLEAAEQALEQAQKQLDEATITAPFDGIIANLDAEVGDTITAGTTIVHLIDLTSMELKVSVDEIDISIVRLNQKAVISIDALPALQLEGGVTFIHPLPTVEAGLVLYSVTISFDNPEDSDLKVGMSATADIIINEQSNVLLVPERAIKQDRQGKPMLLVLVNEQVEWRPIITGLSDGLQTEIVEGVSEGDTVVIEAKAETGSGDTSSQPRIPGLPGMGSGSHP